MNARRKAAASSLIAIALLGSSAWADELNADPEVRSSGATRLPSIVVTATTSARNAIHAPASVSVVEGRDLRRQPMSDLADAVRNTVGLDLEDMGLGRRGISIRGMSAEHTLMLVDGQRINASASAIAHSDFELGWVPSEAIERVEVVRGPMSSLYGSEALGGVVNVITRSATDQWQGSLSSYATFNDHGQKGDHRKTGFYLGGPLVEAKLGLNLWGELRERDDLRDAHNPALTALDDQRAVNGHVGLSWTPLDNQRIDLSMDAGNEDHEGYRGSAGAIYQAENEVERRRYSLSHAADWGWGDTRVRLYRSELERKAYRSDGGDASGPNQFTDTVLDGRAGFMAGRHHKLTLGAETRRETLEDPTVNLQGKKSQDHYAAFAQDEMWLGERWELVLGTRFDHHEDFGWETSPRAYLMFHATDELAFRAGAGRGFKAPTLKQLSPEYESRAAMGGRGIIRGNPDLQPETNQSFELGAQLDRGRWTAGATLFHNDVENLIETVRQPTCFVPGRVCLEYDNIAEARLQGLELSGGVALLEPLRLDANYTYLDAQNRVTDERLSDRSRHRANATLNWALSSQLASRLQAEYHGSQYRSATESDRPGYTLLSWYVDYDLSRNLSLHAGIENFTDKRLGNDDASVYGRADEGRRYFAGLTARF
ncbi:TonB-dependent receptor domain-containing protein [Halopseudomonas pelagia]|mgnify:CR=1 FL=1|uniref:TonB-dependent receptor domain-containing protein n=1 Tax=Halopseudomonas pelagia TaxID=553151 RepID=UPI0030D8DBC5|tara:strand:- start:3726 stop:5693 length:1968 start_codon:yes stop_codon:yes gene_type:complete